MEEPLPDLPDHMEEPLPDLPALMEVTDPLPFYSDIPFRRRQHMVNMTHKVENIKETKTAITVDFKHTHQRFWRSVEGEVAPLLDTTFPPLVVATFPRTRIKYVLDEKTANGLWSATERDSLVSLVRMFTRNITLSHFDWTNLETQLSLCLFNLVSTAKDEGYSAIDAVVFIEVATVDTYDEEEVAWAVREFMSVPNPAPRSSVEALPSQVFDDRISSDKCIICLDEYSRGTTVTQLPCSHDFHKGCIERWFNENNSCPICRSPI